MIILIDDKKRRQSLEYGWPIEKLNQFEDILLPIYTPEELKEFFKTTSTSSSYVLLYHESFLNGSPFAEKVLETKKHLEDLTTAKGLLVTFSGGTEYRTMNENTASLPVNILYQNLETFCIKYRSNNISLNYLFFGEHYDIEKKLVETQEETRQNAPYTPVDFGSKYSFFLRGRVNLLPAGIRRFPDSNTPNKFTLLGDVSDKKFSSLISQKFEQIKYDYIFIPLCFGPILSDYNGLRLAIHFRCSQSKNQLTPIFIYGFVGIDKLLHNPYFNILKTKNVFLIGCDKSDLEIAPELINSSFKPSELPKEINYLDLNIPENYLDNHSIQNEWAMYRWSRALDIELDEGLEKVFNNVKSNIYFKYLQTIHPEESAILKIPSPKLPKGKTKSRVLLIDDEEQKGWFEILCNLLPDSSYYFDSIGDGFRKLSAEDIITKCIAKIIDEDFDIILLDFRINENDHVNTDIEQNTSLQLLKKIKEVNPGIQVILFSATNKTWNYKAMLDSGADGYVHKSSDHQVIDSIKSLTKQIDQLAERAQWLKAIYKQSKDSKNHLHKLKKSQQIRTEVFTGTSKYLDLAYNTLASPIPNAPFDSAFTYYFLILESLASVVIDETPLKIRKKYYFKFRKTDSKLLSFENSKKTMYTLETKSFRIPYNQKFLNLLDYCGVPNITNSFELVSLRNEFMHPEFIERPKLAKITKENVLDLFSICKLVIQNL